MGDELIFASFGALLALIGIGLICFHVRSRRAHELNAGLSDRDRRFLSRQYSRRMQTSSLTVVLGGLIAIGGRATILRQSPTVATIYVCTLLLLALWLMLLGIGDAVASRIHAQRQQRAGNLRHANLSDALAEVRATYGLQEPEALILPSSGLMSE